MPRLNPKSTLPTIDLAKKIAAKIFRELKIPTGESLTEFAKRTGAFINNNFSNEMGRRLKDAYRRAIREVSQETGVRLEFGAIDDKFMRKMLKSPSYSEALKNYSTDAQNEIKKIIHRASQERMSYLQIQDALVARIGVIESRGKLIANNEMGNVYKNARDFQFRKVDPDGTKYQYDWIGPDTHTTTEICKEIKRRTRNGVTRQELLDIIEDVATGPLRMKGFDYLPDRAYIPHFSCRHKQRMRT